MPLQLSPHGSIAALQHCNQGMELTNSTNNLVSFGSASLAIAITSFKSNGANASGSHSSVSTLTATQGIPMCTAAITSGTVDIPTASAPMIFK
jgi:hypothetical protein